MTAAYAFDAYGTLLDVHSAVHRHAEQVGPDFRSLSDLWRAKQLEYAWVRTLMGEYDSFWRLTELALDFALERHPAVDRELRPQLLDAYLRLDGYADVLPALAALRSRGARLAVLSNGSPEMLRAAAAAAGLDAAVDELFSIEPVGVFKPHQQTYAAFCAHWALPPAEVTFVSSNRWDVAGAGKAGMRTVWLNRTGQPDEYPHIAPDRLVRSLAEL